MATTEIGAFVAIDLTRSENDTDDIIVHLSNSDGTDATVTGWTATLSIGIDNDSPVAPPTTFPGVGGSAGLIPINMTTFTLVKGTYKYDIRITDTITGDTPARVYFKGKFKVTPRIN